MNTSASLGNDTRQQVHSCPLPPFIPPPDARMVWVVIITTVKNREGGVAPDVSSTLLCNTCFERGYEAHDAAHVLKALLKTRGVDNDITCMVTEVVTESANVKDLESPTMWTPDQAQALRFKTPEDAAQAWRDQSKAKEEAALNIYRKRALKECQRQVVYWQNKAAKLESA